MEEQFQVCFQRIAKRLVKPSQLEMRLHKRHRPAAFTVSAPCFTRSSSTRQLQLLSEIYRVIQQGDILSSMLQDMMERVVLPLVSHCSTIALNDFFVANVSHIISLLLSRFTKVCP